MKHSKHSRIRSALPQDEESISFEQVPVSLIRLPVELFIPQSIPQQPADIILPLVVGRTPDRKEYTIIDGCKRFGYLKKLRRRTIPCAVLQVQISTQALGFLRIKLNRGRSFSLREKVLLLKWTSQQRDKASRSEALKDMGLTEQDILMHAPLFSAGSKVLDAVDTGALHLSMVKTMLLMSAADQSAFLAAFKGAGLSFQTQREFLEWLTELSYTEKTTVGKILSRKEIRDTLNNVKTNWPQRIEKLREILYNLKFPRLSAAQKIWKKVAASANPVPDAVRFIPSTFFEKNRLEVRCTLSDPALAAEIFGKLADIPEVTWQTLIYPISGMAQSQ